MLSPHGNDWAIKGAGNNKYTQIVPTQSLAVSFAKEIAKNQESELFIHNRQGKIRERNTYSNDENPPRG